MTDNQRRAEHPPTRSIAFDDLPTRLHEILDDIQRSGRAWMIHDRTGHVNVVLAPEDIGKRVLGLFDVEYGWPVEVDVDANPQPEQLACGYRRHPFLMRQGRCIAVAISRDEYDEILKLIESDDPQV